MVGEGGESSCGECAESVDMAFDTCGVLTGRRGVDANSDGTEGGCDRCVDFLGIAVESEDWVAECVVLSGDDVVDGAEDG